MNRRFGSFFSPSRIRWKRNARGPLSAALVAAGLVALALAIPAVAVFACFAFPAGAIIGLFLMFLRGGQSDLVSLFTEEQSGGKDAKKDETPADVPFLETDRFSAIFELRYHPIHGRYRDQEVRKLFFLTFWPQVHAGVVDGFELRDRVMKMRLLTVAQRTQLMKDLTEMAQTAG